MASKAEGRGEGDEARRGHEGRKNNETNDTNNYKKE